MFKNIVYATDGSDHARQAMVYARDLAKSNNATLFVVHAYPSISDLLGYKEYDAIASRRIAHAQEIVGQVIRELKDAGIDLEQEVLEGPTAEAILRVADIRKADLIIVGARGRGSFKGLLLGSVSQKVIQHAPCPVLVVRNG